MPQFDAGTENGGEILDQIAEVHAVFGREVEQKFAVVKRIFRFDEFHVELVFGGFLVPDVKGSRFEFFVFFVMGAVLGSCHTENRAERRNDFCCRNMAVAGCGKPEFDAARGFDNYAFPGFHGDSGGVKVIDLSGIAEPHADDFGHFVFFVGIFVAHG